MRKFDEQFRRKSIRLKNYDYSSPGYYFVTICTFKRECVLGNIVINKNEKTENIVLSPIGNIIQNVWLSIPEHHKNIKQDEYIIMPNHLHGIIEICKKDNMENNSTLVAGRGVARYAPTSKRFEPSKREFIKQPSGSLPVVIASFKSEASKQIHFLPSWEDYRWQRNYYEHIIRDEKSLYRIRSYIKNNPGKWQEDIENPENFYKQYEIEQFYNGLIDDK